MSKQLVYLGGPAHAACFNRLVPRPKSAGFTLAELLVVLALLALLLTIAVPAMTASINTLRLNSVSATFVAHLHLSRSESIKRNGRVVMCKSPLAGVCASSGGWEQGWLVFHDVNNNARLDSGEAVIQQEGPIASDLFFSGNQNVAKYVSYSPLGTAKLTSGAFQAGTVTLCQRSDWRNESRQIVISGTGRPRIVKVMQATCP
jgi:type IV fimbrial biogenesis protein FimT